MAAPTRFELAYIGRDGQEHRPAMLHRAILGSLERFVGILVEHFSGKFPLWLSPEQIRVLPITDDHLPYAKLVAKQFESKGTLVTEHSLIDDDGDGTGHAAGDAAEGSLAKTLYFDSLPQQQANGDNWFLFDLDQNQSPCGSCRSCASCTASCNLRCNSSRAGNSVK